MPSAATPAACSGTCSSPRRTPPPPRVVRTPPTLASSCACGSSSASLAAASSVASPSRVLAASPPSAGAEPSPPCHSTGSPTAPPPSIRRASCMPTAHTPLSRAGTSATASSACARTAEPSAPWWTSWPSCSAQQPPSSRGESASGALVSVTISPPSRTAGRGLPSPPRTVRRARRHRRPRARAWAARAGVCGPGSSRKEPSGGPSSAISSGDRRLPGQERAALDHHGASAIVTTPESSSTRMRWVARLPLGSFQRLMAWSPPRASATCPGCAPPVW